MGYPIVCADNELTQGKFTFEVGVRNLVLLKTIFNFWIEFLGFNARVKYLEMQIECNLFKSAAFNSFFLIFFFMKNFERINNILKPLDFSSQILEKKSSDELFGKIACRKINFNKARLYIWINKRFISNNRCNKYYYMNDKCNNDKYW